MNRRNPSQTAKHQNTKTKKGKRYGLYHFPFHYKRASLRQSYLTELTTALKASG